MINHTLLDYVRAQKATGATDEAINQAIVTQGWSAADAKEVFAYLAAAEQLKMQPVAVTGGIAPSPVPEPALLNALGGASAVVMSERPVVSTPVTSEKAKRSLWDKAIPRTNYSLLLISLLLVFGLDAMIVYSNPSLMSFWLAMLAVLAAFVVFVGFENFILRNKFKNTRSRFDGWINALIVVRNFLFILNFIPVIQLLGLALLFAPYSIVAGIGSSFAHTSLNPVIWIGAVAAVPWIAYVLLIVARWRATKNLPVLP